MPEGCLKIVDRANSAHRVGLSLDGDTIRRTCEADGQRALCNPPPIVAAEVGQALWGSCDGTMARTRELGWKEVRATGWWTVSLAP